MSQNQLFDTENPLFNVTNYNSKRLLLTLTEVSQFCQILQRAEPLWDRLKTMRQVATKIILV